jgi:hypothetical protein
MGSPVVPDVGVPGEGANISIAPGKERLEGLASAKSDLDPESS